MLLDTYKAHQVSEVVARINDLGCMVEYVPGGCTGLSQPMDIGICGPFKSIIKKNWLNWLHSQEIPSNSAITPPTRVDAANWIVSAWKEISTENVKNSFKHRPFNFVE